MKQILLFGGLAVCLVLFILPLKVDAATHGPTETIQIKLPPTLTSGTEQAITLMAKDENGNTWDVTNAAQFTTTDPFGVIEKNVYTAGKVGSWKIMALVGNLTAEKSVKVVVGKLDHLVVNPNSHPEIIRLQTTRQFEAVGFDINNNKLKNVKITWSVEDRIGEISQTGLFKPTKEGLGKVLATSGNVTGFVSVKIIKAYQTAPVPISNTNTNTSGNPTFIRDETKKGEVAGEETTNNNTNTEVKTAEPAKEVTKECKAYAWWIWLLIMVGYLIVLIIYYFLMRKVKGSWWWIFPVLLTAAALWYFFAFACGKYNWWPWVTVIVGILATLFRPRSSQTI